MTEEQLKRLVGTYRHDVQETSIIFRPISVSSIQTSILAPSF